MVFTNIKVFLTVVLKSKITYYRPPVKSRWIAII